MKRTAGIDHPSPISRFSRLSWLSRRARLIAAAVCAAAIAIAAPTAASGYWVATAAPVSLSITPAQMQLTSTYPYAVMMTGRSGTGYASVSITNTGSVPFTSLQMFAPSVPSTVPGLSLAGVAVPSGTSCALVAEGAAWAVFPVTQMLPALAPGESIGYCMRFTWTANSTANRGFLSSVMLNFTGITVAGHSHSTAPITVQAFVLDAPAPPAFGCADNPSDPYSVIITLPGDVPTGMYEVVLTSPSRMTLGHLPNVRTETISLLSLPHGTQLPSGAYPIAVQYLGDYSGNSLATGTVLYDEATSEHFCGVA